MPSTSTASCEFPFVLMEEYFQELSPGSKRWSVVKKRSRILPCPTVHHLVIMSPTWAPSRPPTKQCTAPYTPVCPLWLSSLWLTANFLHSNFSLQALGEAHVWKHTHMRKVEHVLRTLRQEPTFLYTNSVKTRMLRKRYFIQGAALCIPLC